MEFPIRINRYLFLQNICSRREADRLIEQKKVLINGKPAVLGQQVQKSDTVTLEKSAEKQSKNKRYFVLNKPVGVVSHNPQLGEKSAQDFFKDSSMKLAPLGRLDKASHGLMILSNDGTIVDKLLNPKYEHEKEYILTVDKRIEKNFLVSMSQGVNIEGYMTKPATTEKIDSRRFRITLTEGKKHQLRRMCAALGYQIADLKRTRVQNITLGSLKKGESREITGKELQQFLDSIR